MTFNDGLQIAVFVLILILATPLVGELMAQVISGQRHFLKPVLGWLEKLIYRIAHVNEHEEMNWKDYAKALLVFNVLGFLAVFALQFLQSYLPLNPQKLADVSWHLAFNTAVSFMTNTNWQGYAGEATMSYLTQMLGLTVQNFLSAATGMAVFFALARGLSRQTGNVIGNFWVDVTRITVYILLPFSSCFAVFLMGQGVVQNFSEYTTVTTLEGAVQVLPQGPAASQIAIKQIGSNGGGFFNANSTHPFENPTPLSNLFQMLMLLLIASGLTWTYGKMIGSQKQGWTIFGVMLSLWLIGLGLASWAEYSSNPVFQQSAMMEGKETRFGVVNSLIWSTATTAASNGSVNSMHSSLSPLAGGIAMLNIMLGEVVFGGVGAGMYGMILFIVMTVFLSGLMIGRTPEYLGKKIEAAEMKVALLGILAPSVAILIGAALSLTLSDGISSLLSQGPHGLSEVLYAFASAAGNNGSAFAGLNANTLYYNLSLGIVMLVGRFAVIFPVIAMAGMLVGKKKSQQSAGTFQTDGVLFGLLLIAVILIVGGLTFFPVLSLGPLLEHFLMMSGRSL